MREEEGGVRDEEGGVREDEGGVREEAGAALASPTWIPHSVFSLPSRFWRPCRGNATEHKAQLQFKCCLTGGPAEGMRRRQG